MAYRKYPKYKDSGIEWIGEVPEHWEVKKSKYLADIVLGKMLTPDDKGNFLLKPYLRAQNIAWENVDISDVKEMWFSQKEIEQYRLQINDLLISEGGEVGRTAIWKEELNECYIQNSVHKLTIQNGIPRFFLYSSIGLGKRGFYNSIVNQVSIAHLTKEKLREVKLLFPPLPEQQSIASFLDRKTSHIDTYIRKKQKQIDHLKEYRTAVINQAVTRGLNPDVKIKDSGIEWIGEIPEHWEVKKLKYISKINPTKDESFYSKSITTSVLFLPMEKVNENGTYKSDLFLPIKNLCTGFTYFQKDDIIIAKITPCFENGKGALIDYLETKFGFGSTEFHVIRAIQNVSQPKYLYYFTKTHLFMKTGEAFMTGAAGQKRVPTYFISEFKIGVPPLSEQQAIADYLDKKTKQIDILISQIDTQLAFLKEYRTALISETTTGKIDVRETTL